ncbi:helix-turn-helix domain-containing protein [Streptomyces sp. NPDC006692]|uniref:helix-turn-helix domain-containing protein n=1 Tax=Streptomyces sp. NPDC006692 TaxID=3364758 RepID=UPI0036A32C64
MRRASGILAMAEGMSNAATARAAGRHVDTARSWRKRFTAERLAALVDRPRPLGRPRLSATDNPQVIAAVTAAQPPTADDRRHHVDPPTAIRSPAPFRPGGLRLPGRTHPGRLVGSASRATTPGPVRLPRRTGPGPRHLRLGLRRTRRQALPLDLRRQPGQSRTNARRINATLH